MLNHVIHYVNNHYLKNLQVYLLEIMRIYEVNVVVHEENLLKIYLLINKEEFH